MALVRQKRALAKILGSYLSHSHTNEDALIAILLEALDSEVAAKCLTTLYLDAEISHELDLKVDHVIGQAVAGDLSGAEATNELLLLEDGDVLVAHAAEEGAAAHGRRAAAHERDLGAVAQSAYTTNTGKDGRTCSLRGAGRRE